MKIAFVINTLSSGGAEHVVCNLTRFLPEEVQVDLILNDDQHIDYSYRGRIISLGLPADRDRMKLGYQLKALRVRTRKLRKLKKSEAYDAVISLSENANLANVLSGGRRIVSVHHAYSANKKKRMYVILEKLITHLFYNRADAVVTVSKEIEEELCAIGGVKKEKLYTILNGVPLEEIPAEYEKCPMNPVPKLVTVGRLVPIKGQANLLRVLAEVKARGEAFALEILGDGPLRGELGRMVCELGLEQEVSFSGFVNNVKERVSQADLLILSSFMEGCSNVLLEAQAWGVPVISTDHQTGAREILAPGSDFHRKVSDTIDYAAYGVLVPVCSNWNPSSNDPLSPEEHLMAEAILKMLRNPELRRNYREKGLQRKDIGMAHVAEQWLDLIRRLYETS